MKRSGFSLHTHKLLSLIFSSSFSGTQSLIGLSESVRNNFCSSQGMPKCSSTLLFRSLKSCSCRVLIICRCPSGNTMTSSCKPVGDREFFLRNITVVLYVISIYSQHVIIGNSQFQLTILVFWTYSRWKSRVSYRIPALLTTQNSQQEIRRRNLLRTARRQHQYLLSTSTASHRISKQSLFSELNVREVRFIYIQYNTRLHPT